MADYTTIAEVQVAVDALVPLMIAKGCISPRANFRIQSDSRFAIELHNAKDGAQVGSYQLHFVYGATARECVDGAFAHIDAMPSPEAAITHEYLKRVASAVDYATDNSIADEYVAPLRGVSCAMTDNLLAGPK